MSPRSSYLPKNCIYRYLLPCSCFVLDLFACVWILVYALCQIPGCQDSITCKKPNLSCVCWDPNSSHHAVQRALYETVFLAPKFNTNHLPTSSMFNSRTNLIHPSRHTPRSEQLPRLCFLCHSSPSQERATYSGNRWLHDHHKCSGTLHLFTDSHRRHLMLPGDS